MKGGEIVKLSEIMKIYRKEHKISTRVFAERIGCTNAYVSLLENDKIKSPSITTISGIAKAMNISLDSLLGEMDDMNIKMSEMLENKNNMFINEPKNNEIPLYSELCCGTGIFVDDNIEDYIAIPNDKSW